MRYELRIALRYLRARRRDAFISITTAFTAVGVMIGVAALIIVLSIMNGFEVNLRQRVLALTPHIQITSLEGAIANADVIAARADHIPGVLGTAPFVVGQAMVSSGRGVSGVVVRGVEPANPVLIAELGRFVSQGALANLASPPAAGPNQPLGAVALGATLAGKLKIKLGDEIRVVAPIISGLDAQLSTKTGRFTVAAIFDSGVNFIDRDAVFMALPLAQSFFGREGKADGIEVQLKNLNDTARITGALRGLYPRPYEVRNWIEFNQAAAAGFAMLKRVYSLVMLMLVGVAAFNLVATLIMVVMEKRKDVAVLVTMGATPREVRMIFVLKGLIVGAAGTLAGLLIGAVGCFALATYHLINIPREVYMISTLPIEVRPINFVVVAAASLVLCLIATIYPARQAARQIPVEVLRS